MTAYAGGSVSGALLAGYHRARPDAPAASACLAVVGLGALLVSLTSMLPLLTGAFAIGAGEGFFLVVYLALRADLVPDAYMGRATSVARLLAGAASGVAVAWTGFALEHLGGRGAF